MHYRSDDFNEEKPNRYTIIRSQFDKLVRRERSGEAGAILLARRR